MKKFSFVFLLAAILLTGCVNSDKPTEPSATAVPTEPTAPPVTAPQQDDLIDNVPPTYENMYSVALPISTEHQYAEDGTIVSRYLSQSTELILPDREVAEKIQNDFSHRTELARFDSETVHDLAESLYENGSLTSPLFYDIHYDVTRVDQGVLSLFGQIAQSGETSHTVVQNISANYDMLTGDVLTLGSILYRADAKSQLAELVIKNLEKRDDIVLFKEFRDTVNKRFSKDESNDEDFYFSTTGLCFYFSPYELASYSYGTVIAEIPYSELLQVIGDNYFPVERTYASGSVQVTPFTNEEWEKYEQFAQIITEDSSNTQKILLTSDANVQNIRIHEVFREGSSSYITQSKNIYASNILSSKDAILMEADFSGEYPRYILSYTSEGGTKFYNITLSEQSGHVELTESTESITIRSGTTN